MPGNRIYFNSIKQAKAAAFFFIRLRTCSIAGKTPGMNALPERKYII